MNNSLNETTAIRKSYVFGFAFILYSKFLSRTGKEIYGALDDRNVFNLKFLMLQYILKNWQNFGDVSNLDASYFKYLNFVGNVSLKTTFLRKCDRLDESKRSRNVWKNFYQRVVL